MPISNQAEWEGPGGRGEPPPDAAASSYRESLKGAETLNPMFRPGDSAYPL